MQIGKHILKSLLFAGLVGVATAQNPDNREIRGSAAGNVFPGADWIRTSELNTHPQFVQFDQNHQVPLDKFSNWFLQNMKVQQGGELKLTRAEGDALGYVHYRYQQMQDGIPVLGGMIIAHTYGGMVTSFNGEWMDVADAGNTPSLVETAALTKALQFTGASVYKWQIPAEEAHLKLEQQNPEATYYPSGTLKFVPINGLHAPGNYVLAYEFDIYAQAPLSRKFVYVDAVTGQIVHSVERIHTADVTGTAVTKYSGTQTFTVDMVSSSNYRLRETGRGNGIETYDLNTGTSYGAAVDFTDSDNFWNNINPQQDEVATDAHWGAEATYDYYFNTYGRNSIDGAGFKLLSYVHYDVGYDNAFWDGTRMTYGDGSGTGGGGFSPLTAIDVTGHEITHGLTTFTADLMYSYESGALNESFSDIFGACVEFYKKGATSGLWKIGEDMTAGAAGIRSMSNPNSFGDPDCYLGTNWYTGSGDNGGVHTNSGVQNYWFYLLTQGGSGTNDLGNTFNVTGQGIVKAGAIAFRNLTVYLTTSSQYADARFYSILSATDLYGACTPEVAATTNAWYACGVGPAYVPYAVADFTGSPITGCSVPMSVTFNNTSINGSTFQWDFGDGGTSTAMNPSHTYTSFGDYTVTLKIDGGACGKDTLIRTSYVSVQSFHPCVVVLTGGTNTTQTACSGTMYDPGGPSGDYGDNEMSTITISPTGAATVSLTFTAFNYESGYDYLTVYDGPTTASPVIGSYTGTTLPPVINSTGGSLTIKHETDIGVTAPGFALNWNCTMPSVAPTANFVADVTSTCDGEVNFTDLSINGPIAWSWNFGDGGTSTLQHPSHTYTANGTYTVTLTSTNAFGSDNEIKTSYITVNRPAAPTSSDAQVCEGTSATLTASGSGSLYWYDAPVGGTLLGSGTSLPTGPVSSTTSYYVETQTPGSTITGGPANNSFGTGGYFNSNARYLIFDVNQPSTLKTVNVYAGSAGSRTIELRNSGGTVLNTATVNLTSGLNTVTLNFPMTPGTDYQLGVSGSLVDMYRNNASAVFPYNIGGVVSITGTNAGTPGYYYFFYNWVVEGPPCVSPREEVVVSLFPDAAAFTSSGAGTTVNFTDASTAGSTGHSWTFGDGGTSSIASPSHTYASPGAYTVCLTVTGPNGCVVDHCETVYVAITGMQDLFTSGLRVFPNPATGMFTIDNPVSGDLHVSMVDITGRTVQEAEIGLGSSQWNVQSLPSGVYTLVFRTGETVNKMKLVIE